MAISHSKPHVLIIEDDDSLRRGLARFFDSRGYSVAQFVDAEEAMGSSNALAPDLVLCDYRLPGMSGVEVLRLMECGAGGPTFVLMTAYCTDELKQVALGLGAFEVLEKPFDLLDLARFCDGLG